MCKQEHDSHPSKTIRLTVDWTEITSRVESTTQPRQNIFHVHRQHLVLNRNAWGELQHRKVGDLFLRKLLTAIMYGAYRRGYCAILHPIAYGLAVRRVIRTNVTCFARGMTPPIVMLHDKEILDPERQDLTLDSYKRLHCQYVHCVQCGVYCLLQKTQ